MISRSEQIQFQQVRFKKTNSLVLVGFMGVGKTTIAAILGKKLAYKILDSDAEIERLEQTSIAEIFKKGESFFRDLETKFLLGLQNLENTVLSVGGGIIEREKNLTLLQKIGAIFFLEMPLDLLWQRIKEDKTRPKITQSSESEEQNFLAFKNLYHPILPC